MKFCNLFRLSFSLGFILKHVFNILATYFLYFRSLHVSVMFIIITFINPNVGSTIYKMKIVNMKKHKKLLSLIDKSM